MGKKISSKSSKDSQPPITNPKSKSNGNKTKNNNSATIVQQESKPIISRPSSGKLPINLLHEHAQRSKWEKVEYDMFKIKDGMKSVAKLNWIDPKSKEKITIKCDHDLTPKNTPIEARYDAATIALHRVCFNKNLSMVLPREYKDIWIDCEIKRKLLLKENKLKHDQIYNNDPFKVYLDLKTSKANNAKILEIKKINDLKSNKKSPIVLTSINKNNESSSSSLNSSSTKKCLKPQNIPSQTFPTVKFPKKIWDQALSFKLSTKQHELIQNSIKTHINWKLYSERSSNGSRNINFEILKDLGFRDSHIKESLNYQDPLSFLLFNIPDDDLPEFFSITNNIPTKDLITITHKNEFEIKKIMEFGISRNKSILTMNENNKSLNNSIISLTQNLIYYKYQGDQESNSLELWEEEIESLITIFNDDIKEVVKIIDESTISIQFNNFLNISIYKSQNYPLELSGFIVSPNDSNKFKLPNYVKLKILEKLADYVQNNLLGDCYIYSIIDWLQQHCERIIETPGLLLDTKNNIDDELEEDFKDSQVNSQFKKNSNFIKYQDLNLIKLNYESRLNSSELSKRIKDRSKLPAWKEKSKIIDLIDSNQITLITGETGSGKSTQLVQFILDELLYKNSDFKTQIICTQPRRISAIGLAERVAHERVTTLGDEVGYMIRGVNKTTNNTKIKFVTNGILVKFLQNGDEFLNNTILVIDEVHERSMEIDLTLIMIKRLLSKNKKLKIVLMSATVDIKIFQTIFHDLKSTHISGRTFPIQDFYLGDVLNKTQFKLNINDELVQPKPDSKFFQQGNINYDLIAQLVNKIDEQDLANDDFEGSILIFLPGIAEISKCIRTIENTFGKASIVLPLHSALTSNEQQKVFGKYPGRRKIIVSTNIAETSITIDDCVVTIDSGKVKQVTYNNIDNTTKLVEIFESKAEAKQRRGRAGRVSSGISYKLFTENTFESMLSNPIPEIKRINLDSLYLVVKSMGIIDVVDFLKVGIDPPEIASVLKSEEILKCSGLIDEYNDLTQLGNYISMLPTVDPKHGKLLIYSIIFNITDIGILIASVLSVGNIFLKNNIGNRDFYKASLSKDYGDLLSAVLLVKKYLDLTGDSKAQKKFLTDHQISFLKINEIKTCKVQYISILKDIGFIPFSYSEKDPGFNKNDDNLSLLKSLITAAFYPQVARVQFPDPKYLNTSSGSVEIDQDSKLIKYWIRNEEYITKLNEIRNKDQAKEIVNDSLPATRAFIHPSSVLFETSNKELDVSQLKELQELEKLKDDVIKREDGLLDFEDLQKLKQRQENWKPQLKSASSSASTLKNQQFLVYNSSSMTNKLYIRDLTPTSVLSALLFGGPLRYDLNNKNKSSPGIVLDDWLPIRTWCKTAVLIKELRVLLDQTIMQKLESANNTSRKNDEVLNLIIDLLEAERLL
ncbi:hypothetical protein WICMUC_004473 [Wickerhamomyces mucosus]|uniref:RNA helicase n=1 Tax=Wickerhamomyces mucosus TaxID=1378264 RepID=A0A9P8TAL5_9ASCO|nr:hypothetical protein WICMUC_004473 [Wickerhamomyces mucosus]